MSDPLRDISVASSESLSKEAKFWVKELDLAAKREKKWRKKAEEVWKLYEGAKAGREQFQHPVRQYGDAAAGVLQPAPAADRRPTVPRPRPNWEGGGGDSAAHPVVPDGLT